MKQAAAMILAMVFLAAIVAARPASARGEKACAPCQREAILFF